MLTDQELTELMNLGARLEYKGRPGSWVFKFKWPNGREFVHEGATGAVWHTAFHEAAREVLAFCKSSDCACDGSTQD